MKLKKLQATKLHIYCKGLKLFSVESLWADDPTNPESIKLAKLQEVIDIMDVSGRLGRGVVTGVSIGVGENNEATEITQTNVIDVYLDR